MNCCPSIYGLRLRENSEYSVRKEIIFAFWSAIKRKGTGLHEEIRELNNYLDALASKFRRFHTALVKKDDEDEWLPERDRRSLYHHQSTYLTICQAYFRNLEEATWLIRG